VNSMQDLKQLQDSLFCKCLFCKCNLWRLCETKIIIASGTGGCNREESGGRKHWCTCPLIHSIRPRTCRSWGPKTRLEVSNSTLEAYV
jgi:hypothetical protein